MNPGPDRAVRPLDAHIGAVRRTHKGQLLKLIAGVAGSDAQGLVLMRQLLGRPAVPSAFERGRA